MHRPFAAPSASPSHIAYKPVATEEQEYPSIDDFLDELPPIESFLAVDHVVPVEESPAAPVAEPAQDKAGDDDWIKAGWNSYDFSSLTGLMNRTPSRPVRAIETSQPATPMKPLTTPGPSAEEVALALDGIARRIRSGELVIDNLHGMPPEAAMAAAIAALLRMRE